MHVGAPIAADAGDLVTLEGGAVALVLPGGRAPALRITTAPACPSSTCAGRLRWTRPGAWTCRQCGDVTDPADLVRELAPERTA